MGILKIRFLGKGGAHCVGCVVDDDSDVSDGGDVEDSHDLSCKLSIHWNVTNASRTALNTICCGFLVLLQVFAYSIFSYFLAISFGFIWASSSN